jgi:hypothetical protein
MRHLISYVFLLTLLAVGMAFAFAFNGALQVIAAFAIFLVGYLALMISLMICLIVANGVYEGAKWVGTYAMSSVSTNSSISSDIRTPAR